MLFLSQASLIFAGNTSWHSEWPCYLPGGASFQQTTFPPLQLHHPISALYLFISANAPLSKVTNLMHYIPPKNNLSLRLRSSPNDNRTRGGFPRRNVKRFLLSNTNMYTTFFFFQLIEEGVVDGGRSRCRFTEQDIQEIPATPWNNKANSLGERDKGRVSRSERVKLWKNELTHDTWYCSAVKVRISYRMTCLNWSVCRTLGYRLISCSAQDRRSASRRSASRPSPLVSAALVFISPENTCLDTLCFPTKAPWDQGSGWRARSVSAEGEEKIGLTIYATPLLLHAGDVTQANQAGAVSI